MNLLNDFQDFIRKEDLFSSGDRLLLAVSGGVDSVVLCELIKRSGYDFAIAHCNFQLRGKESERDEVFVKALSDRYGVHFLLKKFDTAAYAEEKKIGIQEAARDLRYQWFESILQNKNVSRKMSGDNSLLTGNSSFDYLVTAHQADDNAETVLMNYCRGTGLHGLVGMEAVGHSAIIENMRRPLLPFSKLQLIDFAKEQHLDFVEDSSNESSHYTRNLFRNEIIPAIAKVYPQVKENLQGNIRRFKEIEILYRIAIQEIRRKLFQRKGVEIHIPVKQLMQYNSKALVYEIISEYGFTEKQVEEVLKLGESGSGKFIDAPGNKYRIIRHRHWFIIAPGMDISASNFILEEGMKKLEFALGSLRVEMHSGHPFSIPSSAFTGCFDMKEIVFPLLLRKWKIGDYFYPLGMKKKKKLARYFIDEKLSRTEKELVWVLEMDKKIIWVLGKRIDDRFRVNPNTKKVLTITFQPADPGTQQ